ncbi:MAG: hypothetical protein ACI854_000664 [Arenicella sp.]|jgi:hypothetical protein
MSKHEKLDNIVVEKQQKKNATSEDKNKIKVSDVEAKTVKPLAKEINGPKGLEPTRYGDWESKGRCYDF